MHEHAFAPLSEVRCGDSVDAYEACGCGVVRHVYTYAPGNIRHENLHEPASWTSGYAHGIARATAKPPA